MTPLRLLPGLIIAALLVLSRFVAPMAFADARPFGFPIGILAVLIGAVGGIATLAWWLFFSSAPWSERVEALALMIVAGVATPFVLHESIAVARLFFYFHALSTVPLAFVAWAVASRRLSAGSRHASMVATILLAFGAWALVRTSGISGQGGSDFHWRWTPTPEERLLAAATAPTPAPAVAPPPENQPTAAADNSKAPVAAPATKPADTPLPGASGEDPKPTAAKREAEWPGFRGPNRDDVITGVRINTDWNASPPVELWRRPIGPGWSSFAVDGDLVYTQEQRGDDEVVACYRLSTGEPVWLHRDAIRFYESGSGAGPRGTPAVRHGRVYALGATGQLNALNAGSGTVLWSRNAATDTGVTVPDWGVASSPLAIDDLVIVAVSGRLAAYDARSGHQRWLGPKGGAGYSSPHLVTIDGVPQIVLLRGGRTVSVAPADGALLWDHVWEPGAGFVQPALTADDDVLLTVANASGLGIRRIAVARQSTGWTTEARWTSSGLKPYFNDFVVHKGHAFGFDGSILSCIDLTDGSRTWKGGRYGHGQMVLLADQDLLLVLSEEGELALVSATPDGFTEIARVPAIEGKTWNHPVVVRDILLVRNGEEMAAFRLPPGAPTESAPR